MPPRPPKPENQPGSPRRRARRRGHIALFDALSRIANAEISAGQISDFVREIGDISNHRGAAILLATHLESALQLALAARLKITLSSFGDIFGNERSPMGSFDSKIRMAHAIGMLTDNTRETFDIVRRIRNAFAHAMVPISFSTKEVIDVCALLEIPKPYPPTSVSTPWESPDDPVTDPLWRYRRTCETLQHNLFVVAGMYRSLSPTSPQPDSL